MSRVFELIEPTDDIIRVYNDFWNGKGAKENIRLFKNGEEVCLGDLIRCINYEEKDELIRTFLRNGQSVEFLSTLNTTYSTQLRIKRKQWNDSRWNISSIKRYCNCNGKDEFGDFDGFVEVCQNITGKNTYSFASKAFSFVCPEKYPIFDSISVSLLNQYCIHHYDMGERKNNWGWYNIYIDDYNTLLDKMPISDDITYKKFDIFLWLYGKAIQEYWKRIGVFSFESVPYKKKVDNA